MDPARGTQSTYDLIAPEFVRQSRVYPQAYDDLCFIREMLPAGSWVADVGCGTGRDTALLRAEGMRVVGVDLSAGMLRAGGLSAMVQADMRALPLLDAAMDGLWCQAALLHLPGEQVPTALAEFARVVRSGGVLHLFMAEGDGEGWEPASAYGTASPRWFTYHREPQLRALLHTAGFVVQAVLRVDGHRQWMGIRAIRR